MTLGQCRPRLHFLHWAVDSKRYWPNKVGYNGWQIDGPMILVCKLKLTRWIQIFKKTYDIYRKSVLSKEKKYIGTNTLLGLHAGYRTIYM